MDQIINFEVKKLPWTMYIVQWNAEGIVSRGVW